MQGKVEGVETKTGKNNKEYYSVTIAGVKGSSFDKKFLEHKGENVEYEKEVNGTFTNFKFGKALEGNTNVPASSPATQQQAPANQSKPITGAEIKLLFITKALESAINGAKLTCKDGTITSDQIMKVADAYLTWMITKGMEG